MKDKQLCVLAVDDCIDVLDLIQLSLETTTRWRVLSSSSAEEGLITAQTVLPDFLLMDVQMSNMDGIEMVSQLRSQPSTKNIPILMLTSLPSLISRHTIRELGITNIIQKPFDWFTLADLVVLGLHSNDRETVLNF